MTGFWFGFWALVGMGAAALLIGGFVLFAFWVIRKLTDREYREYEVKHKL